MRKIPIYLFFLFVLVITGMNSTGLILQTLGYNTTVHGNSGSAEDISFDEPDHTITLSENSTFDFIDLPASGQKKTIGIELTNGEAYTLAWAVTGGSVYWPGGVEPTWTTTGVDDIICWTRDGTNVKCSMAAEDMQ